MTMSCLLVYILLNIHGLLKDPITIYLRIRPISHIILLTGEHLYSRTHSHACSDPWMLLQKALLGKTYCFFPLTS